MACLELRNLRVRPTVKSFGVAADRLDVRRWIVAAHPNGNRMLHQSPQRFAQLVGGTGLAGSHQLDDVLPPQECDALVAMLSAKLLDRPSISSPA